MDRKVAAASLRDVDSARCQAARMRSARSRKSATIQPHTACDHFFQAQERQIDACCVSAAAALVRAASIAIIRTCARARSHASKRHDLRARGKIVRLSSDLRQISGDQLNGERADVSRSLAALSRVVCRSKDASQLEPDFQCTTSWVSGALPSSQL